MARFCDIPAELRNVIYEALLSQSQNSTERFSNHDALALFGVSKQLHHEATSYFYQHNDICIDTPSPPATATATILPPIADKYLRFLRRLKVRAIIAGADPIAHASIARTIACLAGIGAKLDDVHITIQSSLSRLASSRLDDSMLGADNPIVIALRTLLNSGVTKLVRLHLCNAWFTPFVVQDLQSRYGNCLVFVDQEGSPQDAHFFQRLRTGNYVATHMTRLGLDQEAAAQVTSQNQASSNSSPSSIASSVASAFSELDMFAVAEFQRGSHDSQKDESRDGSTTGDSFFSGADIEEWEASTLEPERREPDAPEPEDMDMDDALGEDEDEELDELPQEEFDAIMGNMEDVAHHEANEADITYMTNFAPELLLSRHHLGHLM